MQQRRFMQQRLLTAQNVVHTLISEPQTFGGAVFSETKGFHSTRRSLKRRQM
jgi:hypothetical protein